MEKVETKIIKKEETLCIKKVELKDGFVGMEHKVAENWKEKDIIKKNFNMNEGKDILLFLPQQIVNHIYILKKKIKKIYPKIK